MRIVKARLLIFFYPSLSPVRGRFFSLFKLITYRFVILPFFFYNIKAVVDVHHLSIAVFMFPAKKISWPSQSLLFAILFSQHRQEHY
jgi:hypothetical protein